MRIFIASADSSFRVSLLLLLDTEPGLTVMGMSDRPEGLMAQVSASQPDTLLFDYELAKGGMIGLIGDLHRLPCSPKIIVFSINSQSKERAMAAGADGFISKNFPPDELLPLLRGIQTNETKV